MEELNLGPPNSNPSSDREKDDKFIPLTTEATPPPNISSLRYALYENIELGLSSETMWNDFFKWPVSRGCYCASVSSLKPDDNTEQAVLLLIYTTIIGWQNSLGTTTAKAKPNLAVGWSNVFLHPIISLLDKSILLVPAHVTNYMVHGTVSRLIWAIIG